MKRQLLLLAAVTVLCTIGCAYAADAAPAAAAAVAVPWWQDWTTMLLGGLAVLIAAGKKVQGLSGILAQVADALWALFAPASHKAADSQQATAAAGLAHLVAIIQALPNEGSIGDLKTKIQARAPSQVVDLINQLVTDLEARGISSPRTLDATPIVGNQTQAKA